MGKVTFDITMSLDGFVAGPNQTLEQPLGEDGERLHEWAFAAQRFREQHGMSGGEKNADSDVTAESLDAMGTIIMGRRMFSGGEGPWEDDPNARGWWGDDTPFDVPVFVLTHHPRETVVEEDGTTYTFVADGIESALRQARATAGGKDVQVSGGADVIQQYLRAGLIDEFQLHVAPLFLGDGVRLFDDVGDTEVESTRVIESPTVTHLRYRVVK